MRRTLSLSLALFALVVPRTIQSQATPQAGGSAHAPASGKATTASPVPKSLHSALSVVETIKVTGIETAMLMGGPQCDADGNMYLQNDVDLQSPIHKINLKGEKKAE